MNWNRINGIILVLWSLVTSALLVKWQLLGGGEPHSSVTIVALIAGICYALRLAIELWDKQD